MPYVKEIAELSEEQKLEYKRNKAAEYYQKNKDKYRGRYLKDRDKYIKKSKKYYSEHKDDIAQKHIKRSGYTDLLAKRALCSTRPLDEAIPGWKINGTIYLLTNTISGNRYVGSTLYFNAWRSTWRWSLHNHCTLPMDKAIQDDYDQYGGWKSFIIMKIEEDIQPNHLIDRWRYYIKALKPEYNNA